MGGGEECPALGSLRLLWDPPAQDGEGRPHELGGTGRKALLGQKETTHPHSQTPDPGGTPHLTPSLLTKEVTHPPGHGIPADSLISQPAGGPMSPTLPRALSPQNSPAPQGASQGGHGATAPEGGFLPT